MTHTKVFQIKTGQITTRPLSDAEIAVQAAQEAAWIAGARDRKKAELAQKRYEVETGGLMLEGMPVHTDREGRPMLDSARTKAMEDASHTLSLKTPAGFVTLTAAQIIVIADAVYAHVQQAFETEAIKAAEIDALPLEDVDAYDVTTGWD